VNTEPSEFWWWWTPAAADAYLFEVVRSKFARMCAPTLLTRFRLLFRRAYTDTVGVDLTRDAVDLSASDPLRVLCQRAARTLCWMVCEPKFPARVEVASVRSSFVAGDKIRIQMTIRRKDL